MIFLNIKKYIDYFKTNKNEQMTFGELLTKGGDVFAAVPLILFCFSPFFQLIYSFATSNEEPFIGDLFYPYTVNFVFVLCALTGILAITAYFYNNKNTGLKNQIKNNIPMFIFLILCVWMILTTAINGFTEEALHGDSYRNESLFTYIIYFVIFYFCATFIKSENCKRAVMISFFIPNVIVNATVLINEYITPLIIYKFNETFSAIFHQFNHYGYYLMIAIILGASVFVLEKNIKMRVLGFLLFVLNTYILTLNNTFGCFLACIAAFVFLIFITVITNRKKIIPATVMLVLFLVISYVAGLKHLSFFNDLAGLVNDVKAILGIVPEQSSLQPETPAINAGDAGTGRWSLWTHTVKYISEKPLFGWGIEGIGKRLNTETGYNDRPHNEFLQWAAFFGIPASLIYITGVASVFIKSWKNRKNANNVTLICTVVAFCYLVSSFFGNTMFYTAPFFFAFLGLSNTYLKQEK